MGIQINGQNDTISATDGSLNLGGTVTVNVTGDATGLSGTPNVNVGVLTAASAVISGNLQVDGTTTTLDTLLTEVDKLEVGANNTTVGVAITQSGTGDILRLYDGASQVVTVADGGNVGIGTDDPDSTLTIRSSGANGISLQKDSGNQLLSSRIFLGSSSGSASIFNNTGSIVFHTGAIIGNTSGDEKVRITSSGSVGIGSQSPGVKLDVQMPGSSSRQNLARFRHEGQTDLVIQGQWGNQDIGSANGTLLYNSVQTLALRSGSSGDAHFVLRNSGNIGIGTDNPSDKLHVYSSGANTISTIDSVSGDAGLQLRNSGNGNWSGINFIRERSTGTNVAGGSIWMPSDTSNNGATLYLQTQSASANAGQSGALTDNNGVRLKLASQPNGVSADSAFSVEVGSQERFRIDSSGNIGIGTDNPDRLLHLGSTGAPVIKISDYDTGSPAPSYAEMSFNGGNMVFSADAGNVSGATRVAFNIDGSEKVRITSDGKVGIGTDNPSPYKVDINHVYTEQGLRVRSRYGNIATAMVKFDTDPNSDGGDGNVLHIHGGSSRTDSEIVTIDGTGPGNILHVRGDGLIRTYKNVELQNASLLVTGNSSYDQQTSIFSYNTHSATGHRPVWNTFVKFIVTASSGTQLRIPLVYQGNYWTRTLLRGYGISAQYNSANPKPFSFTCGFGHLTTFNSTSNIETTGNLASISYTSGTNASNPPTVNLNFTSAYTGATNQGLDLYLEWFTSIPSYSVQPDLINLN